MTQFDDRERAHEAKYARDSELAFKSVARRNRLLGEWAAELLGKSGDAARTYALGIVNADFAEPGQDDVLRHLKADLDGLADEATIRAKMAELTVVAAQQIQAEG